jgi:hypothetical protein
MATTRHKKHKTKPLLRISTEAGGSIKCLGDLCGPWRLGVKSLLPGE